MTFWFDLHGADDGVLQGRQLSRVSANYASQIYRVFIAQTQEQAPLGSQSHPIALAAKVVTVRRYKAYSSACAGQSIISTGALAGFCGRDQRVMRINKGFDIIAGTVMMFATMLADVSKWHFFNKGNVQVPCQAEFQQFDNFVIVLVSLNHRIELNSAKAGATRCLDSVEYLMQFAYPGDTLEICRLSGCRC